MKLFKTSLLLIFSLFIISCGDDDDAGDNQDLNIAGTYDVIDLYGEAEGTDIFNGMTSTYRSTITSSDYDNLTMTFSEIGSNGRGTITTTGTFLLTETIVEDGITDVDQYREFLDLESFYSINGDNIIILGEGDVEIENLTDNGFNLVIRENESDSEGTFVSEATIELRKR